MTQRIIDIGTSAGAGDGDNLRTSFDKINQNFTEIYGGNVIAANVLVHSVAGRQGNVELTWLDVAGVATVADVTGLSTAIDAANAAARAYTDDAVTNLGPIPSVDIRGGTIADTQITGHSWATLANLSVTGDITAENLTLNQGLSVDGGTVLNSVTVNTLRFADDTHITTAPVPTNLSPVYAAIAGVQGNVTAANAQIVQIETVLEGTIGPAISDLYNRLDTANAAILVANTGVSAANLRINSLFGITSVHDSSITVLYGNAAGQSISIAGLRANIEAANASIATTQSSISGLTANAAFQEIEIGHLRANITAANSAIAAFNSGIVDPINANISAANAAIISVQNGLNLANTSINQLFTNAAVQSANLATLSANAVTQSLQITALTANAAVQDGYIALALSRINSADAAIVLTNANVAAANADISGLRANITAANAQIALRAPIANPTFTGTLNASSAAVTSIVATDIAGTLTTAAQPNITSLGNLITANVTGSLTAGIVNAITIYGSLQGSQPGITALGTLASLNITGNITSGNITTTQLNATRLQVGTLGISSITMPGALNAGNVISGNDLVATGNVYAGGSVYVTGNVNASNMSLSGRFTVNTLAADRLYGTLYTNAQPYINSLGTLDELYVTGNVYAGNVYAGNIAGTILDGNQPNLVELGTLRYVNVLGDAEFGSNVTIQGNLITNDFFPVNSFKAKMLEVLDTLTANIITANLISGTLTTASQPNITAVGTLVTLNVGGTATAGAFSTAGNATASWFLGNVKGRTVDTTYSIASDVNTATMTVTRTASLANVTASGNIYANAGVVHALLGDFETMNGQLLSPSQTNITQLGTLSSLTVVGPVRITGDELVSQNMYVTGNLYVAGNTTTVDTVNVRTQDLQLTLANNAVNSTAARGAGLLVGDLGAYGNLTMYNGVWTTPNSFAISGNTTTGNLAIAVNGQITFPDGTVQITAADSALSATVLAINANVTAANAAISGLQSNAATQETEISDLRANITAANSSASSSFLAVNANVAAANAHINTIDGNLGTVIATTIPGINANVAAANSAISTLQANVGAFELYANANVGTIYTHLNTLDANVGAFEIYSNANVGTIYTHLNTLDANVGAFELYANANVGTIYTHLNTLDANVGAFELYANANVGTIYTHLNTLDANVGAYETWANSVISGITTNSNANVIAYLTTYSGNISAGNVNVDQTANVGNLVSRGNVTGGTVIANYLQGTLTTAAQTNITSLGTLLGLNVSGSTQLNSVLANDIHGTTLEGTLTTGSQTNIYQVGTLYNLDVTGTITGGDINITHTGTFADIYGNVKTASQPSITFVGNLTRANVTGNLITGNTIGTYASFTNVAGTLQTASQPNVTFVGNLTTANVTGNLITGNISTAGTVATNNLVATGTTNISGSTTLANAAIGNITMTATGTISSAGNLVVGYANLGRTNISSIATITDNTNSTATYNGALVVAGGAGIGANVNIGGNATIGGNASVTGGNLTVTAGDAVMSGNLYVLGGYIRTNAAQGNIFNLATTVINIGGAATTVNIGAATGNVTTGNDLTVRGKVYGNVVGTLLTGILTTSSQPNVTTLGTLVDLNVNGNITAGGNANITGWTNISSNASIGANAAVSGNLSVVGNIGTSGYLNVTSNVTAGNAYVAGQNYLNTVFVTSTAIARNTQTGALQVAGGASIVGNIITTGYQANIYSTTAATSTTTGALIVAGGAGIGGNLYIGGNATVIGTLNIGAVSFASINGTPIGNGTPATGAFTTLAVTTLKPAKRATLNYDFTNSLKLDPSLVFVRNSPGTYVDARGNVTVAANGVPRFSYDSVTLQGRGILIEESRKNLLQQSNGFSNASVWTSSYATLVTPTQTVANIAPTGKYESYLLYEDNTNNTHALYFSSATYQPTLTVTGTYTASVWAKAAGRTAISIFFVGEGPAATFDLSGGSVSYEPATYAASITPYTNGWYRCQATLTKTSSSGNVAVTLASGTSTSYAGDGASGALIHGFQLEAGGFATSYIPNTTDANTRAADSLTIKSSAVANGYDVLASTVLVDAYLDYRPSAKVPQNTRSVLFSISDGTTANRVQIVTESIFSPSIQRTANINVYNSGVLQTNANIGLGNLTSLIGGKVSAYYTTTLLGTSFNGNVGDSKTALNIGNVSVINIGSGPGAGYVNGTISKLQYFPTVSSSAELNSLTL